MAREKKNFFSYCALPSRLLSYSKIVKGECNGKRKEEFLFILQVAGAVCGIFK